MGKEEFNNYLKGLNNEYNKLEKTVQKQLDVMEQNKGYTVQLENENIVLKQQLEKMSKELKQVKSQLEMQKEMAKNYMNMSEKQEKELEQYRNKYSGFEEQQGSGKGRARAFSERYWLDYLTRWAVHEEKTHSVKAIHARITAKAVERGDKKMADVSYETVRAEVNKIRIRHGWRNETVGNRTVWHRPHRPVVSKPLTSRKRITPTGEVLND